MDLNLIRVFVAVYETRSLTTAAARLYVTQPAVSQALGRLRRDLNDPLFRRVGRAMEPTPMAVGLFPGFRDGIAGIDRTVDGAIGFDPARSRRRSRIALSELGEIGYFPSILRAVRSAAPHLRVEAVPLDVQALPDWLSQGTIDLAVTSSPVAGGFEHAVLKSQAYGVLMSRDHPLAAATDGITLADYLAADQVVVAGDSGLPRLESAFRRAGAVLRSDVVLNHFASLPPLLATSPDLLATVPDTIAAGWAQSWPLVVQPLPLDMQAVEVCLYRRTTTQQLGALDWLYETVERAVRGTHGEFFAIHGAARAAARPS
ncbi:MULTISPECIES: LysR family transcriptional regulator [unclassified Microbacterium]|uniref:LysR family transcriptional regulator n=1 Tax=unclassified Microbacterium TaxID=2609290 RepID=UPI00214C6020|nr:MULTISPECIES: LysR family transcriptional regulator [unclassified Microbacterium]MCR2808505.1 LysR family transcriptional regulator [Microbacterium sp. zg.B185]WIM19055.1 LysR family transcriptional regulator [Microbacterium sp. zg-B185]